MPLPSTCGAVTLGLLVQSWRLVLSVWSAVLLSRRLCHILFISGVLKFHNHMSCRGSLWGYCVGHSRDFCNLKAHAFSSVKYSCRNLVTQMNHLTQSVDSVVDRTLRHGSSVALKRFEDFFYYFFSFLIIFTIHRLNFMALIFLSFLLFPSICFLAIFLSFMGDLLKFIFKIFKFVISTIALLSSKATSSLLFYYYFYYFGCPTVHFM